MLETSISVPIILAGCSLVATREAAMTGSAEWAKVSHLAGFREFGRFRRQIHGMLKCRSMAMLTAERLRRLGFVVRVTCVVSASTERDASEPAMTRASRARSVSMCASALSAVWPWLLWRVTEQPKSRSARPAGGVGPRRRRTPRPPHSADDDALCASVAGLSEYGNRVTGRSRGSEKGKERAKCSATGSVKSQNPQSPV